MSIILIVLLLLVIFGFAGLPHWYGPAYRNSYGYAPSGVLFVIIIILLILFFFGGRF